MASIVEDILANERRATNLRITQNEFVSLAGDEPVERQVSYLESDAGYRVKLSYPGIEFPPPQNAGGASRPYLDTEVSNVDGPVRVFFGQPRQGMVLPADGQNALVAQSLPITGIRPFGGFNPVRLSEYLIDAQSSGRRVDLSVTPEGRVAVSVYNEGTRRDLLLDPEKNHSIVEYKVIDPDQNVLIERSFLNYRQFGEAWIAGAYEESYSPTDGTGAPPHARRVIVDTVDLETPISPEELVVHFPAGSRVADLVTNRVFVIEDLTEDLADQVARIDTDTDTEAAPPLDSSAAEAAGPDASPDIARADPREIELSGPSSGAAIAPGLLAGVAALLAVAVGLAVHRLRKKQEVPARNRLFALTACGGIALALVLGATVYSVAQRPDRLPAGEKGVSTPYEADFGVIASEEATLLPVVIHNPSRQAVTLNNPVSSCRCISISEMPGSIPPAGSATVVLTHSPLRPETHRFRSTVLIESNRGPLTLQVGGASRPRIGVIKNNAQLGSARVGTRVMAEVVLEYDGQDFIDDHPRGRPLADNVYFDSAAVSEDGTRITYRLAVEYPGEAGVWASNARLPVARGRNGSIELRFQGLANNRPNVLTHPAVLPRTPGESVEILINGLAPSEAERMVWEASPEIVGFSFKGVDYDPRSTSLVLTALAGATASDEAVEITGARPADSADHDLSLLLFHYNHRQSTKGVAYR